jgi:hypothetical protein
MAFGAEKARSALSDLKSLKKPLLQFPVCCRKEGGQPPNPEAKPRQRI